MLRISAQDQDFGLNLLVTSCGKTVPNASAALYTFSNLPSKYGKGFHGAFGFTSLMAVARIKGELQSTEFGDLPQEAQIWINSQSLGHIPDLDPLDTSPYMRRVWVAFQIQSKGNREFLECITSGIELIFQRTRHPCRQLPKKRLKLVRTMCQKTLIDDDNAVREDTQGFSKMVQKRSIASEDINVCIERADYQCSRIPLCTTPHDMVNPRCPTGSIYQ